MKLNRLLSTVLLAAAVILAFMFGASPVMASALHATAAHGSPAHGWAVNILFGGLVVNGATLNTIFLNLKATFMKAFDGAPSIWQETAMLVPSTGRSNQYDWLDRFPDFRQWIGEKVAKSLAAFSYTVTNLDWESTIAVKRNDIEDDQLGIYAPITQDAGYRAKQFPDKIVSLLKNQAFANLCYDGQAFYSANHPVGAGVASNKLTAHLDATTLALAAASYGAARTAIMNYLDNDGQPLGLIPTILEVPPALETTANLLMSSINLGGAALLPNPYKGQCKVLVNPRLTSATAWFLHVADRPIKPFIYQERKAPVFVQQITEDTPDVFMKAEYKFGAEARANGGYGLWQLSVGSDGST